MKKIIIFICLAILLSCTPKQSIIQKQEKLNLLQQEINSWKTFKITGILEAQYQAYSLRNNCIILKNDDKFRADVLGSGLFSLGGGIFMAIYLDKEHLQIKEPNKPVMEDYELDKVALDWLKYITEDLFTDLESNINKIAESHHINIEGFEIIFSGNMRLSEIINNEHDLKIIFSYNRQNALSEINVVSPNFRKFTIHIDKIEYDNINVLPLKNP